MKQLCKNLVFVFTILTMCFAMSTMADYSHESLPVDVRRHVRSSGLLEDNFLEFDVGTLIKSSVDQRGRRRRSADFEDNEIFHLKAFEETFDLNLQRTESVLHPSATVQFNNHGDVTSLPVRARDCDWSGGVISHNGSAIFSTCHGNVIGTLSLKGFEYHIQSLENYHGRQKRSAGHFNREYIVARKQADRIAPLAEDIELTEGLLTRDRRQTTNEKPRNITLEIAVYIDADFNAILNARKITTKQQKLDFIVHKWNGVQFNWKRPELGYDVKLQLKLVHFYETNPPWYVVDRFIHKILKSVCVNQLLGPPYDVVFVQTGVNDPDVGGRAATGGACQPTKRCAITRDTTWGASFLLSHELGHLMNMKHTSQTPCVDRLDEVGGIMGGGNPGWSPCSVQSAHTYIQSEFGQCLYEENIPMTKSSDSTISLAGLLPGMYITKDESCEAQFGPGFRFFSFPHLLHLDSCGAHVCLYTVPGARYGEMHVRTTNIRGMYCGVGKACLKNDGGCLTYEQLNIVDPVPIREGGWSEFGRLLPVSRSCGTGVSVARRYCNNPTPLNSPDCDGEEFMGKLGNTQPCRGDVQDYDRLREIRAEEVCRKLLRNGVINGTMYSSVGKSYRRSGPGQCEVRCERLDGKLSGQYEKWGLFDDGVPCDMGFSNSDWPRYSGTKGHCVMGHCKPFGCDGELNGKTFDACGVCGGNGTSCDVISDVFTVTAENQRSFVTEIPAGAFNIEISLPRQPGRGSRMYLELWSKENKAIFAQRIATNRVSDTLTAAVSFAGTSWMYDSREYLLAKGPVNEPLIVKVFQTTGSVNEGIKYVLSTPLSNKDCTGVCQNGGRWWQCGCQCPLGFGGNDCSNTSSKLCFNGATEDPANKKCQCNDRQFGDLCACRLPFKGENCAQCKISSCFNCGVFNSTSCTCDCPVGYSGLQCDKRCKDNLRDCAQRKQSGKCDIGSPFMEINCALTCGHCKSDVSNINPPLECDQSSTPLQQCTPSEFKCTDGSCIDRRLANDGSPDCPDGSDEPVITTTPITVPTTETSTISSTVQETIGDIQKCFRRISRIQGTKVKAIDCIRFISQLLKYPIAKRWGCRVGLSLKETSGGGFYFFI